MDETLNLFIKSYIEDIDYILSDADMDGVDPQYRLGVRRLSKAFYDKIELFDVREIIIDLPVRNIDDWYAGREVR